MRNPVDQSYGRVAEERLGKVQLVERKLYPLMRKIEYKQNNDDVKKVNKETEDF